MVARIHAYKMHRPIVVQLHYRDTFKKTGVYERLPPDRIIGVDSESFQNSDYGAELKKRTTKYGKMIEEYKGGLRTNLVAINFADPSKNIVLETRDDNFPIEPVFDSFYPLFAEIDLRPSRTSQRDIRERPDGKHRDERRQWVEPIVLIFFNLEYDLGRLIRNHPQFQRVIATSMQSQHIQAGKYDIEIVQLTPTGSSASFEFYVRYDGKIMRIIGRDAWAYIKSSLEEAAETFLGQKKDYLDKDAFNQLWEEMTDKQIARLKDYVATDARLTRELYEVLIELLTSIDKHVICRNGILPKSAAGAAAKMAFAIASQEEWTRPTTHFMEMGALSYAGGRVFNRRPGIYDHINVYDEDFAHGFIASELPDPALCAYIDIEPGWYDHYRWIGQWGCMMIDGEGLDPRYPALRVHDQQNLRLRYLYGPFRKVWATIPEIVLGVESGRLRVEYIHKGVQIQDIGSNENSFLRKFELKMYELKKSHPKGSPIYQLAKLLGHSLAGKLAEVNLDRPYIHDFAIGIPFPVVGNLLESKEVFQQLMDIYIRLGPDGLESLADDLIALYPNAKRTEPFKNIVQYHTPPLGKAGAYYLPVHASQITGMASARLGLAAWCTSAISGHTDSLFTIGEQTEGFQLFHEIEQSAGYESPEEGMGSFRKEVSNAHGVLLRGNFYVIRWTDIDRETGEVHENERRATHGLPAMNPSEVYDYLMQLYAEGHITYETKRIPRKLRESSMRGVEPGVFESDVRERTLETDPNMIVNENGEHLWKRYDGKHEWRLRYEDIPPDLSRKSFSQDTIPPDIVSSSLHDVTSHRNNSGLNIT